MKFEKDNRYILIQLITILTGGFILTFLINKVIDQLYQYSLNLISLLFLNVFLVCSLFFFMVNQLHIHENNIVFKNVYGVMLKKINVKNIKKAKIIYSEVNYRWFYLFSIFGKKYEKMIQVKLVLLDSKNYNFNANILTQNGLERLRKKINGI